MQNHVYYHDILLYYVRLILESMKISRNTLKIYILLILLIIFSTLIFFNRNTQNTSSNKSLILDFSKELTPQEYTKTRNEYVSLLLTQNPRVALDRVREQTKTNNSLLRSCHALTHDLGHIAYIKYKNFAEALKYQDEICNSGYLHGIIESQFSKSTDILNAMQTICNKFKIESYIGWECYHGIGHGLMYFNSNDLPKSIKLCDAYKNNYAASTCRNGVFMENFNTDQKIHPSQFLKASDPFYPCAEQRQSHKSDCYLYAPAYFLTLHKNDYFGALEWCKTADKNFQSTCANGVGSQAIKENINNPKLVEKICMSADKGQVTPCITGMVGLYINHFGSIKPASELCEKLEISNKSACQNAIESRANLFQN